MDSADTVEVRGIGWGGLCVRRGGEIECVLEIARGVLLWDEEGVKVPEGGFDKGIGGHFLESHFEEDVAEFFSHFH
jgi:hypothetical protein